MGKDKRDCVLNFKVTEKEKEIIEKHVKDNEKPSMSEYIREVVFSDMLSNGCVDMYKLIVSEITKFSSFTRLKELATFFSRR